MTKPNEQAEEVREGGPTIESIVDNTIATVAMVAVNFKLEPIKDYSDIQKEFNYAAREAAVKSLNSLIAAEKEAARREGQIEALDWLHYEAGFEHWHEGHDTFLVSVSLPLLEEKVKSLSDKEAGR